MSKVLDSQLLTIEDYRQSYASGRVVARAHLLSVWQQLDEQGCGPDGDTAVIYLPSDGQRQVLLDHLNTLDPDACPLWGVPFIVKDNIDVQSWPTTAACPEFLYTATDHATVVTALMQAGAVPMAKANLDQFATGLVGTRSPYGWVRNAFSDDHISGGSSSGSASVVARGLVPFALGTDTAGSGRIPAGFNNLVGTKPTPGRFSIKGVVPACKTLDCVSIMSLTVSDAAIVSRVLSAFTERQVEPRFHAKPSESKFAFPRSLRVGVPANPTFSDSQYEKMFERCLNTLSAEWSVELVAIDMSDCNAVAQQLYYGPWAVERYLTAQACIEAQAPGLDPTVKSIISQAVKFNAADTFTARYQVNDLFAQIDPMWRSIDVLLVPTAPGLPRYAEVQADPVGANSALGVYTNFVNLLGWSALSTPAGFTADGLPFGVTWIAPGGCDEALLELGMRWTAHNQSHLGRYLRAVGSVAPVEPVEPVESLESLGESTTLVDQPEIHGSHLIAVVGAHLSGMPLNSQLQTVGARLKYETHTSKNYRLFHIADTVPPKPGLVRVQEGGSHIALEVYDVPNWAVSWFLANIPSPLGLGKVELIDGKQVTGFICEPLGVIGAKDITHYGGWRSYIKDVNQ